MAGHGHSEGSPPLLRARLDAPCVVVGPVVWRAASAPAATPAALGGLMRRGRADMSVELAREVNNFVEWLLLLLVEPGNQPLRAQLRRRQRRLRAELRGTRLSYLHGLRGFWPQRRPVKREAAASHASGRGGQAARGAKKSRRRCLQAVQTRPLTASAKSCRSRFESIIY